MLRARVCPSRALPNYVTSEEQKERRRQMVIMGKEKMLEGGEGTGKKFGKMAL